MTEMQILASVIRIQKQNRAITTEGFFFFEKMQMYVIKIQIEAWLSLKKFVVSPNFQKLRSSFLRIAMNPAKIGTFLKK